MHPIGHTAATDKSRPNHQITRLKQPYHFRNVFWIVSQIRIHDYDNVISRHLYT